MASYLNNTKRILVFRIGQLGDTIVALPAFWAVRKNFPTAHLTLLRDKHLGKEYISPEMVLPREGLFDEYLCFKASIKGTRLRDIFPLFLQLRKSKFDKLVYLAPSTRNRLQLWRDIVFFRLAGIREFIGIQGWVPLSKSFSEQLLSNEEHESDCLLRRLAQSGIPVPYPGHGNLNLGLTKQEMQEANNWLEAHLRPNRPELLIGIGPGSKMPSKIWPEERFAALGHRLIDEFGGLPIVFGSVEDKILGDRLVAKWRTGINAAGELNVRLAAAILSRCKLYVGNDTGTMHLAVAVNTPCVAIFSARDRPGRWYPYGQKHIVLRGTAPCEGCKLYVCNNNLGCLLKISIDSVIQACQHIIYGKI